MKTDKYQPSSAISIVAINLLSLLAQIVQIGTITPTLSLFLEQTGATKFQIGWVVAASWLAILLVYRIIPYVIYRLGTINSILISSAISLFSIVGMMFYHSVWLLFCLNFLLGCGLVLRWIVCDTWLLLLTDKNNRGKVIGIHETLMGLGIAIGPLMITVLAHDTLLILSVCFFLILLSAFIVVFVKKHNRFPSLPTEHYDRKIAPLIFLALFAAFATGIIETSIIAFLPLMYIQLGVALAASTMLLSSFGFGGAILQMPIGWVADKNTTRFALGLICLIAFLMIVLLPLLGGSILAYIALFICGGCIGGLNTLAVLDASNKVQETQLSTAMMQVAFAYTLGSTIGPVTTGVFTNYQHYGLLWLSLIFLLICFTLVIISSIKSKTK